MNELKQLVLTVFGAAVAAWFLGFMIVMGAFFASWLFMFMFVSLFQ